jgi:hypothetical protein
MPLSKQNMSISFAQGLDTKTDPRQVVPGKLERCENVVFQTGMEFKKRNGYQKLTSLSNGTALSTFKDELVGLDGENLYSYDEASQTNISKGAISGCDLQVSSIHRSPTAQSKQDSAYSPLGAYCFVWTDSTYGGQYVVVNAQTKQQITPVVTLGVDYTHLKAWCLGSNFIITYITSTHHLAYIALPVLSPLNPGSPTDLSTLVHATYPTYEGAVYNDCLYLAFNGSDVGSAIRVTYLDKTLQQHSTVVEATQSAQICISVCVDSFSNPSRVWIVWCPSGSVIMYAVLNSQTLSEVVAPTIASFVTPSTCVNVAPLIISEETCQMYFEISNNYSGTSTRSNLIAYNVIIQDSGPVGGQITLLRGIGLASKPFMYKGRQYAVLCYSSALQPTYFLVDLAYGVVARIAYTNGGGYAGPNFLFNVNQINDDKFQFSYLYKDLLTTQSGQVYTQTGVNSAIVDFAAYQFQSAEIGGSLLINGGHLSMYDGQSVVEQNFHVFPEDLTATSSTSGTPLIAAGTYHYVAVYEWTDLQGNIHRSAPSVPLSVTIAATSSITVTVPSLRLTKKTTDIPASIVLYRDAPSIAAGIYYRVSSITSPTLNDPDNMFDTVTITDNLADASIIGNALLYTTGGVVENTAPPACAAMTIYKNRLMLVDAEDRNRIWYSKPTLEGVPVEMSDVFTQYIDPKYGVITALAVMDDKLIIFKENAIFYMVGNGPDITGGNNDFSEAVYVTSNIGCTNLQSIVLTPEGLMFQTNKGIWMLGRSLGVDYRGAAVEQYNEFEVTSAALIPNSTQVRFTITNGTALVYDYFYQQWGVYTNHDAVSSVIFEDLFTYINSTGAIYQEKPGQFNDDGIPITIRLTTSWLSLSGFQGYERVYRLYFIGQYKSPHLLQVGVAYDFNQNAVQRAVIDPSDLAPNVYGTSDVVYGASTYGGKDSTSQWRVNLSKQKCQSIQITLDELIDTRYGEFGEGLSLEAISVVVGAKSQYPRLSPSKSVK